MARIRAIPLSRSVGCASPRRYADAFSSSLTRRGGELMKKSSASSARGRQTAGKRRTTSIKRIDYSDIPELTEKELSGMKRVGRPTLGSLPRKAVSIRIDQSVLDWVKRTAATKRTPYQSLINEILAKAMRRAG